MERLYVFAYNDHYIARNLKDIFEKIIYMWRIFLKYSLVTITWLLIVAFVEDAPHESLERVTLMNHFRFTQSISVIRLAGLNSLFVVSLQEIDR